MYRADYHIHSKKSFDASAAAGIPEILAAAGRRKLSQIALTDHYDVNFVLSGENPDINFADTRQRINSALKNYRGAPIDFLLGIELGQPNQFPEKAAQVLSENDFDFILCSLHNAASEDDFYYIDYKNTDVCTIIKIFEKYTEELVTLAKWGSFHSLAHITYPMRYFAMNDIHIDLRKYLDIYKQIFSVLMERGIALEVNTSGLRKKINECSPPFSLLKVYREMGGELITVGSDAHTPADIYSGIDFTCEKLYSLGFRYVSAVKNKRLVNIKLEL